MTEMSNAVAYHTCGWAASNKVEVKKTPRDDGNGGKKWSYFVMMDKPFHVGEKWKPGDALELVVKSEDGKKMGYTGVVEGLARSGTTKILLTSSAITDADKIKEIITKIAEQQNGRTSFTR